MICEDCRSSNPDVAKFCLACGARLVVKPSQPFAERRQMHVVFCDIVDSTALSGRLDPEDLRDLLQHFQLLCAEVVGRYEGYIAQFLGDGVLVYFGYPQAHDDDAQRAVSAGLEIVRAVSSGSIGGHRIQVRVGIHSGLVVVGEVGVPGRRSELAVGETPNIAARMQAEAQPDTVVISEATERLVRGFFAMEELGARSLRGLKQTKRVYAVIGESGARTRLEAAAAGGLTRFVARVEEVTSLSRSWEEARRGRGQMVSIRGEAGVGKSRLVQAFKSTLRIEPAELVECACSEYLRNSAFHPIASGLARKMDLASAEGNEQRQARLESYAARLRPSPENALAVFADLLSIPLAHPGGLPELPPSRRRQLTMETLTHWLLAPEAELPKLVIVEDVHWADASTLELISGLAERLSSSPMLMLLTFRPDFTPPWAELPGARIVPIRPLAREDSSLLASHVARGKALPKELTNRIDEWTRGVPLYIEEFTKGLLESGVLAEKEDRFELSGPLPRSLVPETLAGPLAARIDRLGPAKAVVQLAAVLGMEARYDILATVSESNEPALRAALDRILASELLVERPTPSGTVFQFRHALIRDAAYGSLLHADRREIHRRVFHAIKSKFGDLAESRPEVVAYHAGEAGLAELATDAWSRASERALARAANREALMHIEEGLKQLGRLGAGSERHEKELAFELARGPALMAVKGFAAPEVKATYGRAQDLCQLLGNPSRVYSVLWGLWAHWFVAGELVPARDFAQQAMQIAESTREPALLVPAYHALGYTLFYMAEYEQSLELARRGLALYDLEMERRNTRMFQFSSTVALHHFAATSLWMLGFPEQARIEAEKAIELGAVLKHPPSLAYAKSAHTGGAPFLRRDHEVVNAAALEAIDLFGEESAVWPPLVKTFRGWSLAAAGDVASGLAHMLENFAFYRAIGGGVLRTTVGALKAEATWKTGDTKGALDILAGVFADLQTTQERTYEPELHRVRGEVLASIEGSSDDAEESFRAAIALARQQRARSLELRAAVSFARFLDGRGRAPEGRVLVRKLYDSFTEGFDTRDLREAYAILGREGALEAHETSIGDFRST